MDTPGVMRERSKLNRYMTNISVKSGADADLQLFVSDASRPDIRPDKFALDRLGETRTPRFLLLNKIDMIKKQALLNLITRLTAENKFDEVVPISARSGENLDTLVKLLADRASEGPMFYPAETTTDQPERFMFAEIIREKIFLFLHDELPYSTAVLVEEVIDRENGVTSITASIILNRDSHKGMVIGKKGATLKTIGEAARKDLEYRLQTKVFLDLNVRVKRKWTDSDSRLNDFGYGD